MATVPVYSVVATLVLGVCFLVVGLSPTGQTSLTRRFDLGVGVSLLLYAALARVVAAGEYWAPFLEFGTFFVVGLLLFRQFYLLSRPSERRWRDAINAALFLVPGTGALVGMFISSEAFFLLASTALVTCIAAVFLILTGVFRVIQGEDVYLRDIMAPVLASVIGPWYVFLSLFAAIPG